MTENRSFKDELRISRKRRRWSQEFVAQAIGVSSQAISQWERGETVPNLVNAKRLAELFGTDPTWVLSQVIGALPVSLPGDRRRARLLPWSAFDHLTTSEPVLHGLPPDGALVLQASNEQIGTGLFALQIVDNSMEPEFRPGDIIICDVLPEVRPGDFVVLKVPSVSDPAMLRKCRSVGKKGDEEIWDLLPLNPDFATISGVSDSDILFLGVVVEHRRLFRPFKVPESWPVDAEKGATFRALEPGWSKSD